MGIADRLNLPDAEAWRPEAGDQIVGKVVGVDERDGDYGTYPVITVATENGELVAVHAFHTVLRNELAKKAPQDGDDIGISYRGVKKSGAGREFENYRVVLERNGVAAAVAPNWEKHAEETDTELKAAETAEEPF